MPHGRAAVGRGVLALLFAAADALIILPIAIVIGAGHHGVTFSEVDVHDTFLQMGLFVAAIFILGNVARDHYSVLNYFSFGVCIRGALTLWNVAFVFAMAIAFLTKTSSEFSRATALLFYLLGFGLMAGGRFLLVSRVRAAARHGRMPSRRVVLVGYEHEIDFFALRFQAWSSGMRIITAAVLRGPEHLVDDLALAAASARMLRPDDVFILVPWSDTSAIDACVTAFLRVPAAIHLGPERVLDRFADAKISKMGAIASLNLTGRPLTMLDVVLKRCFDLIAASLILAIAAPLMAIVALAIKLDSRGPVFFLQRRYGFNQEPFRILKFRSMRDGDDARTIAQATRGDPRFTRVGRFLRCTNIDELPQLFNVLLGHMSLVGPRPHALAHDQQFESGIALYARRHNVKPGITGWAQVSGYRGEMSTSEAIRLRVEHDLWYIDNWSFLLDLRIMGLTAFSPKA